MVLSGPALIILLLSPAVLGDDTPVAASSADAAPPAGDQATQLGTVVVTGELLQREARRTTSSVAVQDGAQVERSTARSVYDVIRDTPNVSLNDDSGGYGSMTIRGISSYGANTYGQAYIYSSTTSIVLDGVGLPRAAQAYADLSAFDLDRVEIFRGPQSTSQGRNAMAGAVVITSAEPLLAAESGLESLQWRGRLAGSTEAGYQGATALDYTAIPDQLGLRIGVEGRGQRGDIRNITLNQDDWDRDESHNLKLRLAWQPGGADGRYRLLVSARDLDRFTGSPYVEQAYERQREATANEPVDARTQGQLYSADQRLRLDDRWRLQAISAYVRTHTFSHFDLDYSADDAGTSVFDQPSHDLSQELRVRYEGRRLRGTLGAYYFRGRDSDAQDAIINVNALATAGGLCTVAVACTAPIGNVLSDFAIPTRITDQALFGEADWRALDRLTITAGLRLDQEQNHRDYVSYTTGDNAATQVVAAGLQAADIYGPNGSTPVDREFSTFLPKLAVVYEVFDGWFAGASYSKGYRPGGGGYNPSDQKIFQFGSEHTSNYELSLKGGWQPLRLEGALSVFHTDWRDMQVQVGSGFDTYIDNAGLSKIDGGELELRFHPWRPLRVVGGLGISRGRFVDYVTSTADYSGNPLLRDPKSSASLAVEWQVTHDLLIRPDLSYVGGTPAQPDNGPTHQLSAYALLNLAIRWQQGPVSLFLNGQNLADRFYRTDAATYGLLSKQISAIGPGRLISAGLDFRF